MGWIHQRAMRSGTGLNPNPSKQRKGPLRAIVAVLTPSKGMFDPAYVELECGHRVRSNGIYTARCSRCASTPNDEAGFMPASQPSTPKDE